MNLLQSKGESSTGSRRLVTIAEFLESVVQDILFFFILSCVGILLVWSIVTAMHDIANFQGTGSIPTKNSPQDTFQRCIWPAEWCRFFANIQKRNNQEPLENALSIMT